MSPPKIHLTSILENKQLVIRKIESLGGFVLDQHHNQFNNECTHLVVYDDDPKPTERVMAAMAAGLWIVRTSWVEASSSCGYWLPEEPYECDLGKGLPRHHRLRAAATRDAAAAGYLDAGKDTGQNRLNEEQKATSGAIFTGWTICIDVQKSLNTRQFRRVLSAGGAVVIQRSELGSPGVNERLNLVLCDDHSLPDIRQLVASETPIARHFFLRDVLLQKIDPANLNRYIYPPDYVSANKPISAFAQPAIVVDISNTPTKVVPVSNNTTPSVIRRPATLRRRNRTVSTISDNSNNSITEYFSSARQNLLSTKTVLKPAGDIVVIDDDDNTIVNVTPPLWRIHSSYSVAQNESTSSDCIMILDDDDLQISNNSNEVSRKKLKTENGLAVVRAPKHNRYSVESEGASDDQVISLELDDNDDIQVVSVNVASQVAETKESTSFKAPELIATRSIDDDDDDCYITGFSQGSTLIPSKVNRNNVKTELGNISCKAEIYNIGNGIPHNTIISNNKMAAESNLEDDDCFIMDVIPASTAAAAAAAALSADNLPSIKQEASDNIIDKSNENSVSNENSSVTASSQTTLDIEARLPSSSSSCATSQTTLNAVHTSSAVTAKAEAVVNSPSLLHDPVNGVTSFLHVDSDANMKSVTVNETSMEQNDLLTNNKNIESVITDYMSTEDEKVLNDQMPLDSSNTVTSKTQTNNDILSNAPNTSVRDTNISENVLKEIDDQSIQSNMQKGSAISQDLTEHIVQKSTPASNLIKENKNLTNNNYTEVNSINVKPEIKITITSNCAVKNENEDGKSKLLATTKQEVLSAANSKITQSSTLPIIGQYLEQRSSFSETFCTNLSRGKNSCNVSKILEPHVREQSKGETGLYWSSVRSTGLLGIDVSDLNSLSVTGNIKSTGKACNHTTLTATGNCVNCHVTVSANSDGEAPEAGIGRGTIVDENDVDVVVNSLLWLRLGITAVHYPNAELIGDMLARYVLKCGVPMVQSQCLSVAELVLSVRPLVPSAAGRPYYTTVLQALGSSLHHNDQIPLGDTIWTIVETVYNLLNIASCGDPSSEAAAPLSSCFNHESSSDETNTNNNNYKKTSKKNNNKNKRNVKSKENSTSDIDGISSNSRNKKKGNKSKGSGKKDSNDTSNNDSESNNRSTAANDYSTSSSFSNTKQVKDSPKSSRSTSLSFERWQYEQHLLQLLSVVLSILEQDMDAWRNSSVKRVEELLAYRLMLGYSNNPAVLPKTAVKLLKLWLRLAPSPTATAAHATLRLYVRQLVCLLLELVWLWHQQRQSDADNELPITPVKQRRTSSKSSSSSSAEVVVLTDSMMAEDLRFASIAREMALAFRDIPSSNCLALIRELPLARHRFFLSNLLPNIEDTLTYYDNDAASTPSTPAPTLMLQRLVRRISSVCSGCGDQDKITTVARPLGVKGEHRILVEVLLLRLQAYLQVTGGPFIVRKVVRETTNRKRLLQASYNKTNIETENGMKEECISEDVKSDVKPVVSNRIGDTAAAPPSDELNTSNDGNKKRKTPDAINSSNASDSSNNGVLCTPLDFYDLFGNSYSKEYMHEFYKRFSSDHKCLTVLHSQMRSLTKSCKHVYVLQLLTALLYLK